MYICIQIIGYSCISHLQDFLDIIRTCMR